MGNLVSKGSFTKDLHERALLQDQMKYSSSRKISAPSAWTSMGTAWARVESADFANSWCFQSGRVLMCFQKATTESDPQFPNNTELDWQGCCMGSLKNQNPKVIPPPKTNSSDFRNIALIEEILPQWIYPVVYRVLYTAVGAGFLPSTVSFLGVPKSRLQSLSREPALIAWRTSCGRRTAVSTSTGTSEKSTWQLLEVPWG